MIKINNLTYSKLLFVITLMSLFTTTSCNSHTTKSTQMEGYKKFIVNEGLANYSFEYPAIYSEPRIHRHEEPDNTSVLTDGDLRSTEKGVAFLFIYIYSTSNSFPDAESRLNYALEQWSGDKDFRLLERSPVEFAGNQGEQIVFSYSPLMLTQEISLGTGTAFEVYFNHNNIIGKIQLISDDNMLEQAKIDFEHIINSFQFIE